MNKMYDIDEPFIERVLYADMFIIKKISKETSINPIDVYASILHLFLYG